MDTLSAERYQELYGKPQKNVANQVKGTISKRDGEAFENLIERACMHYRDKKIADIDKTPEPMRVIGKTTRNEKTIFLCVFTKKAQADFKGTLKGGRSIYFEAKHTDTERITRDRVTEEQHESLLSHWNLGAKCFVILSFGFKNFYKIPFSVWDDMKACFGRKYLKESDIEEYRISFHNGYLDFLDGEL